MKHSLTGILIIAVLALGIMSLVGFNGVSVGNAVSLKEPRLIQKVTDTTSLSAQDCVMAIELKNLKEMHQVAISENLNSVVAECNSLGYY